MKLIQKYSCSQTLLVSLLHSCPTTTARQPRTHRPNQALWDAVSQHTSRIYETSFVTATVSGYLHKTSGHTQKHIRILKTRESLFNLQHDFFMSMWISETQRQVIKTRKDALDIYGTTPDCWPHYNLLTKPLESLQNQADRGVSVTQNEDFKWRFSVVGCRLIW